MRTLNRNMQTFYYVLNERMSPIIDEYGNDTGEFQISYSSPVEARGNISPSAGTAQQEVFGVLSNVDRVIVVSDDLPLSLTSLIFIGVDPVQTDGNYNNNYIVKQVAKSLNVTSIHVSEVS